MIERFKKIERDLPLLNLLLVVLIVGASAACFDFFSPSATTQNGDARVEQNNDAKPSPSPYPSPSPTATPKASPSPLVNQCDFDILKLQPMDGLVVAIGDKPLKKLSLTPYATLTCQAQDSRIECSGKPDGAQVLHEVSEACNLETRRYSTLQWLNSNPAAVVIGVGYEPTAERIAPSGPVVVQAMLENKPSNAVIIR